jgi:hypothetical protein
MQAARLARNLQMLEEAYAPVIRQQEPETPPGMADQPEVEDGDAVCEAVVHRVASRGVGGPLPGATGQGVQGDLGQGIQACSKLTATSTTPALTQAVSQTLAAQQQRLAIHTAASKPGALEAAEQAAAAQAAPAIQAVNARTAKMLQELEEELRQVQLAGWHRLQTCWVMHQVPLT